MNKHFILLNDVDALFWGARWEIKELVENATLPEGGVAWVLIDESLNIYVDDCIDNLIIDADQIYIDNYNVVVVKSFKKRILKYAKKDINVLRRCTNKHFINQHCLGLRSHFIDNLGFR